MSPLSRKKVYGGELKGEDVVVTTPIEDFVTILKGGVHNPAVQRALQL